MFDPKPIMEERQLQDPIPTPVPAQFPHDDEVPEGCIVLNDLHDDWGYYVDIHTDVVYVEREGKFDYTKRESLLLHLQIIEPKVHFGAPEEDMEKPVKWPCIVYIQGSAFHEQWAWNNIGRHIRLAQRGYVIAIVEYRPSEVAPFPAQMQDAKTAVRFMRMNAEKYNVDPELANATIPMNYLSEDRPTPPTLIIHGSRDMLVPFNQSCQLYNYMKAMGKDVTFYKINNANHGCLGFDNDTVLNIVDEFLKANI